MMFAMQMANIQIAKEIVNITKNDVVTRQGISSGMHFPPTCGADVGRCTFLIYATALQAICRANIISNCMQGNELFA